MKKIVLVLFAAILMLSLLTGVVYANVNEMNESQQDSILGIEYIPAVEYTLYYTDDGNGNTTWYSNRYPNRWQPNIGDRLIIKTVEGDKVYVYQRYNGDYNSFVSEEGILFVDYDDEEGSPISFSDIKPKEVDKDNYFTVTYTGKTCQVPVTVKKNTVKDIEYMPVEPQKYIENDPNKGAFQNDGDNSWFKYDLPGFKKGDKLIVKTEEGEEEYIYTSSDEIGILYRWTGPCFSDGNSVITSYDIQKSSNQEEIHWTVGKDNEFKLSYFGKECTVSVEVVKNTVDAIAFAPAKPYTFFEGIGSKRYNNGNEFTYYNIPDVGVRTPMN